tara:strand:+ start:1309 stop:2238 length:930 start_codon:yes stop_codon:yes gene_type:complete
MKKRCIENFSNSCSNNNSPDSKFVYNDDISYDDNILIYRSKLNKYERNKFDSERKFNYRLTFTVSVIYGTIGLIILLLGSFTNWGNQLFFNELYYFTITYIIGTIIIILFLAYQVYSFDFPILTKEVGYESQYCPDFWISKSRNINDKIINNINDVDKSAFNLECKLDYNKGSIPTSKLNSNYPNDYLLSNDQRVYKKIDPNDTTLLFNDDNESNNIFLTTVASIAGYTYDKDTKSVTPTNTDIDIHLKDSDGQKFDNIVPLLCDRVYPLHFAQLDLEYSNRKNIHFSNRFRCKYAELTGLPWTDAGCP